MKKKVFLVSIIILIILLLVVFVINQYRMKNNLPVLFSTWGYGYVPPVIMEDDTIVHYPDVIELIVSESGTKDLVKITTGELGEKYDYDIYYYGLDKVDIKLGTKTMDLKEALLTNTITMDYIIDTIDKDGKDLREKFEEYISKNLEPIPFNKYKEIGEEYGKNGLIYCSMYKDGGTMIYEYKSYAIMKRNRLSGDRDVYIGIPNFEGLNQ